MNDTVVRLNSLGRSRSSISAILNTFIIVLLSPCLSADAARETTEARISARASLSVVGINMVDAGTNSIGEGSGVVIAVGQVITTCHVVGKGKNVHIVHSGKRYEAILQSAQPDLDLCRLNVPRLAAQSATLGSALNVKTGQRVYAVGVPIDQNPPQPVMKKGVISSVRPYLRSQYMRIDAPISSGFSGGGLFDAHGTLTAG